jgi:hypothetical protein
MPEATSDGGDRRGERWCLLGLALFVAAFWLAQVVRADDPPGPLSGDLRTYFVPFYEATFSRVAEGHVPQWNPYHLTGLPWLATLQVGVFYPPHALYVLLPTHVALALSHLIHLLLIAVSTAALARRAGASSVAAVLAGVLLALNGMTLSWLFLPARLEAAAWLPLGAFAALGLAAGGWRSRDVALLGLATGMSLLAGYPQASVLCLYTWGALWLTALLGSRAPLRRWLLAGTGFGVAIAGGVLLSGVQTLPTWEVLRESSRPKEAISRAQASGFGPGTSWMLARVATGDRRSIPVTALALVPAALFARRRALASGALALGLAAYAFGVGAGTDLFELYRRIPGLGWFRDPRRVMFVVQVCAALLAALGADALARREGARGAAAALLGGALAVAALAARGGAQVSCGVALALAGLAAIRLAGRPRLPSGVVVPAILALACAEVIAASAGIQRLPYRYEDAFALKNDAFLRELSTRAEGSRATWLVPFMNPYVKLGPEQGVRWVEDYEPLNLRRHAEYFGFLRRGTTRPADDSFFLGAVLRRLGPDDLLGVADRRRLLDLAATRYFVTTQPLLETEALLRFARAAGLATELSAQSDALALLENRAALPRAYVTYRTQPAPAPQALLRRLATPSFDPLAASFVENGGGLPGTAARDAPRGHAARIVTDEETLVEIDAYLAAPGLVVLADAHARGWRAWVDGTAVPIHATNHLFRGVRASAGRHLVRFRYEAPGLRAGGAASALGAVLLLALAAPQRELRG